GRLPTSSSQSSLCFPAISIPSGSSQSKIIQMKTVPSRERTPVRGSRPQRLPAHPARHNGHGASQGNGHAVHPQVGAWLRQPKHNLIGGRWVPALSGKLFDVVNPADASLLARVPDSRVEDVDRAVSAARRAFESSPWRRMTPSER